MTVVVFIVSLLLTVAGASAVVTGFPYIQIERGWTEVIAGSVALSSGLMIFAIGAVLLRLKAIHRALQRDALAVPIAAAPIAAATPAEPSHEAPTLPEPVAATPAIPDAEEPAAEGLALRSTFAETLSEAPAEEPASEAEPEPAVEPETEAKPDVRHGLWKRFRGLREPEKGTAAVPSLLAGPADLAPIIPVEAPEPAIAPLVPVPLVPIPAPLIMAPPVTVVDAASIETQDGPPISVAGERPTPVAPLVTIADPVEDGSIDWLDRGLTNRAGRNSGRADFFTQATREAASERPLLALDHANDEGLGVPPAASEPTIIGRYDAGVASYVMYSDGTIEVEGEGGDRRRFESMEDLKAFIAKQEAAVG